MSTEVDRRVTTQAQSRAALARVEREHPERSDGGEPLVYDEDGHLNAYQVAWGLHLPAAQRRGDRRAFLARARAALEAQ